MSRILLTAIGSMAAAPVARRYQALGHAVFGCDIYPRAWTPLAGEIDFFQTRLATEGEPYVEQLREAVLRDRLDFLIPLTDPEVDALAPRKAEFQALGCTVCVPEERVAALCRRKDKMNRFLAEKQVCRLIPTESAVSGQPCPFPFPAMVKPRSGRSSLGQAVAADEKSYQTALAGREDCIVQPFLEGDIFCVDVARDAFGHTRAAARQELLRNKSGLGMTVEVLPGHPLEAVCAAIAEAVGLVGVVNMEFIRHGDDFFFLEVNPRFSGGVGFSMAAGMDFAEMMLCCHSCGSVEAFPAAPKHALLARESAIVLTQLR